LKNTTIISASICLLALLTWLALRGSAEVQSAETVLRQLDIYAGIESMLHRDLLRARAGLLRNYDPLVHEVERLHRAIDNLRTALPDDAEYKAEVDRLDDMVGQQERWTEQFKSQNALLLNSLAYFNTFSLRLRETSGDRELLQQASGVESALLRLMSDTSQGALKELDDALSRVALDDLSPADAQLAQAMVAHARLLRAVLPTTDRILKSMFTIPSKIQQDRLRSLVASREAASEKCAAIVRAILYVISLVLVGLTVILALRLRARARTVQRIARIEHAIADISTRFIKLEGGDIGSGIEHALAELASCIDADRAYFLTADRTHRYRWGRHNMAWPDKWPDDALAAVLSHCKSGDGIIYHLNIDRSQSGVLAGLPADLRGWVAIPRMDGTTLVGVLAFDSTETGFKELRAECGLFRMACDALATAIERESLMKERRRLEETLERARRLDTIGAFASGIAHNFNNIVGAILGYTEMAHAQLEMNRPPTAHLLEIRRAGERARDLVEQILKFGRQTSSDQEEISLSNLLGETSSLLGASLPSGIILSVDDGEGDVIVQGQPEQLQQVVLNVCSNAAQAIDGAGSVSIRLRRQTIEAPLQLDHGIVAPGSYAVISVTDTGRGMDEATREQIFEPFFTTRRNGNGLGLATVHEIVLNHGGAVSVSSAPNAGSRFDIWLPCLDRPVPPSPAAAQKGPYAAGETILLFDVDRERLLRYEEIIAALGFEPVGFVRASDAIEALRAAPDRFDAAVLCHQHGVTESLDVARELSRAAPFIPIVLATASAGDLGVPVLAMVGVWEVVRLPLRSGEISGVLARCMAGAPRKRGMAVPEGRQTLRV